MKKNTVLVLSTVFMLFQLLIGYAYAIKNGVPDGNEHPYVCWIVTWDGASEYVYLGTGSLIAPNVVLTAGHITNDAGGFPIAFAWVSFSLTASWSPLDGGADWIEVESWETHPQYRMGGKKGITDWLANDVGILELSKDVSLTEYPQLATEYLMDTLPMKQNVDLVGYGVQYKRTGGHMPPDMDWINFGYRYQAQAQLIASNSILSQGFMTLTANPGQEKGGTCFGDSGSPILLTGTDGTEKILGVCSWGTNGNCAGVSYEQRIDIPEILNWIESFLP